MDTSQEAANRAQVKSYPLNLWMVAIGIIQIILTMLGMWLTQNPGGTFMLKAWLPIILLLLSAGITAIALLILAVKLRQMKHISSEAQTTAAKVERLLDEKQSLGEELSRRNSENKALQRQLGEAQETIKQLEKERDAFQRELVTVKKQKHNVDESLEISRRELDNVKLERLTAGIEKENLKLQFDALKKEFSEMRAALDLTSKRLNQEEIQRDNWIQACNKAERELAELRWLEGRMKQQGENLDTWVRIKQANRVNLQLTKTPRIVVIAFWVKNNSIFTVTFNFKFLTGCLWFKGSALHDPITLSKRGKPIEDLEPGGLLEIILVQPLLRTEAETIFDARQNGDPNAIFSLTDINIPIFVRNIPQEVAAAKLKIHSEIEFMEATAFPCDKNVDEMDS